MFVEDLTPGPDSACATQARPLLAVRRLALPDKGRGADLSDGDGTRPDATGPRRGEHRRLIGSAIDATQGLAVRVADHERNPRRCTGGRWGQVIGIVPGAGEPLVVAGQITPVDLLAEPLNNGRIARNGVADRRGTEGTHGPVAARHRLLAPGTSKVFGAPYLHRVAGGTIPLSSPESEVLETGPSWRIESARPKVTESWHDNDHPRSARFIGRACRSGRPGDAPSTRESHWVRLF